MFLSFFIAIIVIIFDQFIKYLTITHLDLGQSAPGVSGVFDFFYLRNEGASLGMFSGRVNMFIIITIIAVGYLVYLIIKNRDHHILTRVAYGLTLGGAVGNFIDRVRLGYVVDMFRLEFINFPIFNVADVGLTIGVILLIIVIMFIKNSEDVL